jgi:hypothetical protein
MINEDVNKVIKEIWSMFKETDQRFQETAQRFKETDKRLDQRFKKTDRYIKELGKQIGGLGKKFGGFTEGLVYPSMRKILMEQFKMNHVTQRVLVRKNGDELELDALAYTDGDINRVFIVEVKSRFRDEDLKDIFRDLKKFPKFFPEHKDKKLYGIIVAVDISEQLRKKVLKAGLYLALIRDDTFCLDIPEGFKAKCYNLINT